MTRTRGLSMASVLIVAFGCGYRFTAGGGPLPGGARTLYVPVFRNATSEPALEGIFTESLREELARRGREGGEASDAMVEGTLVSISEFPAIGTSVTADGGVMIATASIYRVQATATVRVLRDGAKLAETTVTGSEEYLPSQAPTGMRSENAPTPARLLPMEANRRLALRRLAQSLMRQAYENLAGF